MALRGRAARLVAGARSWRETHAGADRTVSNSVRSIRIEDTILYPHEVCTNTRPVGAVASQQYA